jgi:hypothetical protein
MSRLVCSLLCLFAVSLVHADGPMDNLPDKVRPVPPPGVMVPDADKAELQAGLDQLGKDIETLKQSLKMKPALLELLPDVEVFDKAVRWALTYNEFFKDTEIKTGKTILKQGLDRAQQLKDGKPSWTTATGLVVRGYRSKIDGSVQPYGLVVPASFQPNSAVKHRLDFWFHGRGETLSELNFIAGRQTSPGEFTPRDAFVLHPYGRYCCANKFAGEVDTFECLEHVRKHYPIDDNRIAVRGFSMGGAACWQFATHFAGRWAAAAPGAGFSETADFLKVFQNEPQKPTWYEEKLWHWYDATDYAVNLFNCPTVAYSGEDDKQKQAADIMEKALAAEKLRLVHIIGPKTAHKYEPAAREEVNRRIDSIMAVGRNPVPATVKFTTWTLRYNEMLWVRVNGLGQHWERARVEAVMGDPKMVTIATENVTGLSLIVPPGLSPLNPTLKVLFKIDGQQLDVPSALSDRSWTLHLRKADGKWTVVESPDEVGLAKKHGLSGPIDDAFMDSFLMVKPTGKPLNDKVGQWAATEMKHAIDHWRKQFRGDAPIKDDNGLTEADIANNNLVLWGDPMSNAVLAKIAEKLPIRWTAEGVKVGDKSFDAAHHVPVMIYPNPLNPKKYVVLNSGFTFREYDYLNNARQVAKLPDWAVIDIGQPVTSRLPGGVVAASFFGEKWELRRE